MEPPAAGDQRPTTHPGRVHLYDALPPVPPAEGPSARRLPWVGVAAVVLGLGSLVLFVLSPTDTTYFVITVGTAVVAWYGALRHPRRVTLTLIAAGVSLSALGDTVFYWYEVTGRAAPDVSLADIGWVAAYVLVGAALLRYLRRGNGRIDLDGLIDVAVVAVVAMTVQWELSLDALVSDATLPTTTRLVWMLYPALDSVLLALIVRAVMARRIQGAIALLLAAGSACWLVSDFLYTTLTSADDYSSLLDAGFLAAAMLLAAAAWQHSPDGDASPAQVESLERVGIGRVSIALTPLLVPGFIAGINFVRGEDLHVLPLVGVNTVLVALALARAYRLLGTEATLRRQLRSRERYASALAYNSSDAVAVLDAGGVILNEADGLAALVGYGDLDVRGLSTMNLLTPVELDSLQDIFNRAVEQPGVTFDAEAKVRHRDGHEVWLAARMVNLLHDPDVGGVVVNVHDITERKVAEDELAHQAFHDGLTGLANRALFTDRVEQALRRATRSGLDPAVLFLDLDGFKTVNDSLGHAPGDQLLREVARRLLTAVRPADTVARLGGDEFAILIEQCVRPVDEAQTVADRVLQALTTPCKLDEHSVTVSASLGIAAGGADATAASLLRDADVAMYRAKTTGKSRWVVYDPDMRTAAVERLRLENDLIGALDRQEFTLVYQPVVSLETEEVVGFEALIRWHHPTLGLIEPDRFIPIAEETGLIVPIGSWVLQEACTTAARWREAYPHDPPLTMAVNVSGRQIASVDLVQQVSDALAATGVDPHTLVLEMTETALIRDTVVASERLHELRDLGVQLAIDDFGTGYSSLSYLKQFPVDILKIDRSFIESINDRDQVPAIVRGLLDLGRTLDLETVAEGVELDVQRDRLRDEHCDYAQGFLFARPLAPEDAENLLLQLASPGPALGRGATPS